jgi:hypothetical protein
MHTCMRAYVYIKIVFFPVHVYIMRTGTRHLFYAYMRAYVYIKIFFFPVHVYTMRTGARHLFYAYMHACVYIYKKNLYMYI